MAPPTTLDLLIPTAQIVAAHVATNKVASDDLLGLINKVYGTLARANASVAKEKPQEPAVPIKRSVQPDYLVCLEDGAKLQIMTRYLQRFGLTPHSYRSKWGLPNNYPMVAPGYAVKRSALARQMKLGTALSSATTANVLLQMEAGPPAKVTKETGRKLAAQQSVRVRKRSVNM